MMMNRKADEYGKLNLPRHPYWIILL